MFSAPGPRRASPAHTAVPAHVVVLVPDGQTNTERLFASLGDNVQVTVLEHEGLIQGLAPVDVAILHADRLGLACSPLLRDANLGLPELVFVVDEASSPQYLALRSRGFRHVVAEDDLPEWLSTMLPQLVSLARARRIVVHACADRVGAVEASGPLRTRRVNLHAAETTFRTAFMRALLAEHGSRRRAAEEAGVPYRSFCEMLRKLGI